MSVDVLVRRAPPAMSAEEWQLRLELAACYRLFAYLGWIEMIYNHITVRVPGPEPHYLINPFGLNYEEVTARNLVKVDTHGKVLDGSAYPINLAGFIIHSAIHSARPDAHCIIHTHTTAGCAVSGKEEGLRPDNFYSAMLHGQVAYHDFEGITTDAAEQPRLVKSLGNKNILILRNHGLLVIGAHVPEALNLHWTLQRACEVQLATDSMAGANRRISPEALAQTPARRDKESRGGENRRGQLFFDALLRRAKLRLEDLAGD
ncbi:MAG TPA: class II aldolase/adducin family protein [Alphaproteobacteria bacterium]|nr:class II aldolase/adducin family protein [Alphaproteobacteria bacterium]